jgi:hypothetical protein
MKCPGPGESVYHQPPLLRQHLCRDALDTAAHLGCRSPRERQQHHATGVSPPHNQMRHAMGKRVCLAGTGPGDDKQWLISTVLHRVTLFGVEPSEIIVGHRCFRSDSNRQSYQQARLGSAETHLAFQTACKSQGVEDIATGTRTVPAATRVRAISDPWEFGRLSSPRASRKSDAGGRPDTSIKSIIQLLGARPSTMVWGESSPTVSEKGSSRPRRQI